MLYGKPERRKKSLPDHVPPTEADWVLRRDGECVIAKLEREGILTPRKPCSGRLTIEHLLRRAGRRVHGRRWMVAACLFHNTEGECSRQRSHLRDYVARVETE